jgi:N-acetylglucosaminyldiphosphoundecaprenol N-acetyl-beta-D-mannosaminyltransferase
LSVYIIRILNIDVLAITEQELLERFHQGTLFTPNLDHLVRLQKDKEFYRDYRRADWIVCDSRILLLCSRLLEKGFPEAVPGSGFFHAYCDYHKDDADCRIFLLGSKGNTASIAMEKINNRMGRNMVVDALSPSMGFDQKEEECRQIVERISQSGANVVLVGVGMRRSRRSGS